MLRVEGLGCGHSMGADIHYYIATPTRRWTEVRMHSTSTFAAAAMISVLGLALLVPHCEGRMAGEPCCMKVDPGSRQIVDPLGERPPTHPCAKRTLSSLRLLGPQVERASSTEWTWWVCPLAPMANLSLWCGWTYFVKVTCDIVHHYSLEPLLIQLVHLCRCTRVLHTSPVMLPLTPTSLWAVRMYCLWPTMGSTWSDSILLGLE